ncbi:MAG: methionyl aminopeptidase [Planctomycetota bacterium]|nr:methionyl aminopeptidase [Planctomycetota bacterium]
MIRRRRRLKLNEAQRGQMRRACAFNAELMDVVRPHVKAGITTGELDQIIHDHTVDHGHVPACLNYPGEYSPFPKSCCTSINEVICHGIPGDCTLKDGDIVNIDLTTIVDGWHGDQSETFTIGQVNQEARDVTQCAFDCLYLAIEAIQPGSTISEIGIAIVAEAKKYGFGVVEKYVGHGIGQKFHQLPNIPHVPNRESKRQYLEPGTCFTIEPMINVGTPNSVLDKNDGWTVRTADQKLSAQFEHTILMTESGPEIMTLTQDGPRPGHVF